MQWKKPKDTDKYRWTTHVTEKMHFYGLSEQKVLGVIRKPQRIESSIVENTVAVMLPVGNITIGSAKPKWGRPVFGNKKQEESSEEKKKQESWNQEIWVLYQTKSQEKKFKDKTLGEKKDENIAKLQRKINPSKQITIISAWRYPGVSPKNNPIPEEIMREIEWIT
ncbi:MAG: hypothetical protein HGA36_00240 [Candidatus Moranbacteria bacterium]|nr:hypothetical protein [Candidatus Moranbacteria bacterium]